MTNVSLLLSASVALLGEVNPNLRGVFITRNDDISACLNFYFDKPYSEDEAEMASLAHTETSADFPISIKIDFRMFVLNSPQQLPFDGLCVYLRYGELGTTDNYQRYFQDFGLVETQTPFVFSRLAIIKAMWGKITPSLRKIVVTKNGLEIFIFFEREPTIEEARLAEMIYNEYCLNYVTKEKIEMNIIVIPSNELLPKQAYAAYVRYPELGEV